MNFYLKNGLRMDLMSNLCKKGSANMNYTLQNARIVMVSLHCMQKSESENKQTEHPVETISDITDCNVIMSVLLIELLHEKIRKTFHTQKVVTCDVVWWDVNQRLWRCTFVDCPTLKRWFLNCCAIGHWLQLFHARRRGTQKLAAISYPEGQLRAGTRFQTLLTLVLL